jgi:hypothetical protein
LTLRREEGSAGVLERPESMCDEGAAMGAGALCTHRKGVARRGEAESGGAEHCVDTGTVWVLFLDKCEL